MYNVQCTCISTFYDIHIQLPYCLIYVVFILFLLWNKGTNYRNAARLLETNLITMGFFKNNLWVWNQHSIHFTVTLSYDVTQCLDSRNAYKASTNPSAYSAFMDLNQIWLHLTLPYSSAFYHAITPSAILWYKNLIEKFAKVAYLFIWTMAAWRMRWWCYRQLQSPTRRQTVKNRWAVLVMYMFIMLVMHERQALKIYSVSVQCTVLLLSVLVPCHSHS